MAKNTPAFQFYPADFIAGAINMNAAERGIYITLLCCQWLHLELPTDTEELAQMCAVDVVEFERLFTKRVRKKFTKKGDVFVNERLNSERLRQESNREARKKAGKASASTKRQQKGNKGRLKTEDRRLKIEVVFNYYKERHPRSRLGDKTRRLIGDRLAEGFSVEDLKDAVDGNHLSPFHCGENDRGTKYHKLDLIMRSAEHVNQFIEINNNPPVSNSGTLQGNLRAAEQAAGAGITLFGSGQRRVKG